MSSLLQLATDLEQKSKAQASDIERRLKAAFSAHEKAIGTALRESEAKISAAILAHSQALAAEMDEHQKMARKLILTSWRYLVGGLFLMICLCLGGIWYTGHLIGENLGTLAQQRAEIASLEKNRDELRQKGYGAMFSTCDGRACVAINPESKEYDSTEGARHEYRILENN